MEMRHLYLCLHLQSFIDCRHLSCVQSSVEHALMFYLQNQLFKIRWRWTFEIYQDCEQKTGLPDDRWMDGWME